MQFSDESRLLLENWDAYQDIMESDKRLRAEVQKALMATEKKLMGCNWWGPSWHFKQSGAGQVYIWHENWVTEGAPLVWVGVERMNMDNIFGNDASPQLYVWVVEKHAELVPHLRDTFASKGTGGHGELVEGSGCYVIKDVVPTCLPEEIDSFESVTLDAIVAFFSHYAECEEIITEAIRQT